MVFRCMLAICLIAFVASQSREDSDSSSRDSSRELDDGERKPSDERYPEWRKDEDHWGPDADGRRPHGHSHGGHSSHKGGHTSHESHDRTYPRRPPHGGRPHGAPPHGSHRPHGDDRPMKPPKRPSGESRGSNMNSDENSLESRPEKYEEFEDEAFVQLRLDAEFDMITGKLFAFKVATAKQLSKATGWPQENIIVASLQPGSIIVRFEIKESEECNLNRGMETLKKQLESDSLTFVFEGKTMTVLEYETRSPRQQHHSKNWKKYAFICGVAGLVVILACMIMVGLFMYRTSRKRRFQNKRDMLKQNILANSFDNEIYGKLPEKVKFDDLESIKTDATA